jgi:hypothetical protein
MKNFIIGEIIKTEEIIFENPMHKGFLANNFPYISGIIAIALISFCLSTFNKAINNENNGGFTQKGLKDLSVSDVYPFMIGVFPSLFLILTGVKLWFGRTFRTHRIGGLLFLLQYASSWYFFFTNYELFKNSFLVWTLLLNGCLQAVSAIIEVGPTLEKSDSGEYFGNKNVTVSRDFITENLYYQILTTFSSLYYYPQYYNLLRGNIVGKIVEVVFVFLPFVVVRPFFPKTLLR